jgi:hypothetical protein
MVSQGSLAGFDGNVLEVRSAGEDAWLCKPAPANPLIDQPDVADEETAMVRPPPHLRARVLCTGGCWSQGCWGAFRGTSLGSASAGFGKSCIAPLIA